MERFSFEIRLECFSFQNENFVMKFIPKFGMFLEQKKSRSFSLEISEWKSFQKNWRKKLEGKTFQNCIWSKKCSFGAKNSPNISKKNFWIEKHYKTGQNEIRSSRWRIFHVNWYILDRFSFQMVLKFCCDVFFAKQKLSAKGIRKLKYFWLIHCFV